MTNEKKIIIDFIDYYEHPQKLIEILDGIGDFLSLTKTKYGIEIISFCPDLTQNENYLNSIPQKRYGTPEDVANVVGFLVSDEANYITGQVIHIDGGLVM